MPDNTGVLLGCLTAMVDKGRATEVNYLDLCKPFDTVLQNTLVPKLERHGFEGWTTQWMRNWMDGCTQEVLVNDSVSKWRPVMSGIPQGLALGPAVLNIFVGNMESRIKHTFRKFSDDSKQCDLVNRLEKRDAIQRELDVFERWDCANLMN